MMTQEEYLKELEERRAAEVVEGKKLRTRVTEIVEHLGCGWEIVPPNPEMEMWERCFVDLTGMEMSGRKQLLRINTGDYKYKDRIVCSYFLKGVAQFKPYKDSTKLEITCKKEKSALQIAKEIQNRLLPDAQVLFAYCAEKANEADDYIANTKATAESLAKSMGLALDENTRDGSSYYIQGKGNVRAVRIDGANSIKIELHSVTALQAETIINLLKDSK